MCKAGVASLGSVHVITLAILVGIASARPARHLLQDSIEPFGSTPFGGDLLRSLGCGSTVCQFPDVGGNVRSFFESAANNFGQVVQNIMAFATGSAPTTVGAGVRPLDFSPLRDAQRLDPQQTSAMADATLTYLGGGHDEAVSHAIATSINPGLQPVPLPPPSQVHTISLADTVMKAMAKADKIDKDTHVKVTSAFGKGMHMAMAPCAEAYPGDIVPKCCPGIQQPVFVATGLATALGYKSFHEDAIKPYPVLQKCF